MRRIGFDLDGVIIDKPPIIPKGVLEWLVRSHTSKKLAYRYPSWAFERWLRWVTHHPILRPPIKENLKRIRQMAANKNYKIYVVSSRFSFLEERTRQWFKRYWDDGLFQKVCLNLNDEQPHLFKENMIKKLALDVFVDDDWPLVKYLRRRNKKTKIIYIKQFNQELS